MNCKYIKVKQRSKLIKHQTRLIKINVTLTRTFDIYNQLKFLIMTLILTTIIQIQNKTSPSWLQ